MSLIKCSECGKEISDQAKICPNCGCPNAQNDIQIFKKGEIVTANVVSILFLVVGILTMLLFGLFCLVKAFLSPGDITYWIIELSFVNAGLFTVISCWMMFRKKNMANNVIYCIAVAIALLAFFIHILLFDILYHGDVLWYGGILISPIIEFIALSIIFIMGIILKIKGLRTSILSFMIVAILAISGVVVFLETYSIDRWKDFIHIYNTGYDLFYLIPVYFCEPIKSYPMILNPVPAFVSAIIVLGNIPYMIVNKKKK